MSEPDHRLIAEFNARRSEEAFAALVRQHVNLVFATALRQVGDAGAAEEITQNVFVVLAQAAGKLGSHPTIAGWLHQTALNKSREWLRSELRRRRREQVAVNLELARAEGDSVWSSLVPLLDEALLELREPDRLAVILHFMEGRTFHEVGSALGIGEDTARKRVNRCLEQLTHFFRRRGFAAPALVAGVPLFTLSSHAAPAGLAASATTAGLTAAHSAASTSTLTLIKGALKIMAWTKAKTVTVAAVGILFAAGTTTVTVEKIHEHQNETWQLGKLNADFLQKPPYRTVILPTKSAKRSRKNGFGGMVWIADGRVYGLNAPIEEMLRVANVDYGSVSQSRTVLNVEIPTNRYDFFSNPPKGSKSALRLEIKRKLGVAGRFETIETNVLFLKVRYPDAAGLKPSVSKNGSTSDGNGSIRMARATTDDLAVVMENHFKIPVINQTGLTNNFDIKIQWNDQDKTAGNGHPIRFHLDELKQALTDQLGLELVPAIAPVEMLVIERAKN